MRRDSDERCLSPGDAAQLPGDALVVDLHFEFFVETVLQLGVDPGLVARRPVLAVALRLVRPRHRSPAAPGGDARDLLRGTVVRLGDLALVLPPGHELALDRQHPFGGQSRRHSSSAAGRGATSSGARNSRASRSTGAISGSEADAGATPSVSNFRAVGRTRPSSVPTLLL